MWNQILTSLYRSGRRLVPIWDWPDILPNWSVIFSSQSTEDTIPDMEFGTTHFVRVSSSQNFLNGRRLQNRKQNKHRNWIRMRENGSSLNFISLQNPSVDKNWVCRHCLSAAVLPLKMMPCIMFWSIQTFSVNGKFTEHYHVFCAWIDLFTIFVCSHYGPSQVTSSFWLCNVR